MSVPLTDDEREWLLRTLTRYRWRRVGGCWLWTRACMPTGYGEQRFRGTTHNVHRLSWMLFKGPIPGRLHVLHRCDIRRCFNPDHLFLGTNQDNTNDKIAKGRMRHGHVYGDDHPARKHPETYIRYGEEHPRARITWDVARQIRSLSRGGVKHSDIATMLGVNRGSVYAIVNNQQWREPSV